MYKDPWNAPINIDVYYYKERERERERGGLIDWLLDDIYLCTLCYKIHEIEIYKR